MYCFVSLHIINHPATYPPTITYLPLPTYHYIPTITYLPLHTYHYHYLPATLHTNVPNLPLPLPTYHYLPTITITYLPNLLPYLPMYLIYHYHYAPTYPPTITITYLPCDLHYHFHYLYRSYYIRYKINSRATAYG